VPGVGRGADGIGCLDHDSGFPPIQRRARLTPCPPTGGNPMGLTLDGSGAVPARRPCFMPGRGRSLATRSGTRTRNGTATVPYGMIGIRAPGRNPTCPGGSPAATVAEEPGAPVAKRLGRGRVVALVVYGEWEGPWLPTHRVSVFWSRAVMIFRYWCASW